MHWRYRLLQGLALIVAGIGIVLLHAGPTGTTGCVGAEPCAAVASAPRDPAPPDRDDPAEGAVRPAAAPLPAAAGAPRDPGGKAVRW